MRMIDADALQELCDKRIQEMWNSKTAPVSWAHAYADFKDDVDSMPTLTQPNEWVNAEERLPEEGESVLCIVNGKPRKNITLCEAYQLGVWCKEDGWLIDEYPEWRDVEVLWWMPLPDAPEGEK